MLSACTGLCMFSYFATNLAALTGQYTACKRISTTFHNANCNILLCRSREVFSLNFVAHDRISLHRDNCINGNRKYNNNLSQARLCNV